ncbi:protein of unknown function DUF432 [Pyrolobus fumarii 1A]|uniref:DUF432 domain-containing protein n=2 Tax=Pyrolobus fumarii TaxID=54252 RepID=G0EDA3_PYRF1|nr:protein of unknown function DUF432 [Pyrolobus fumarii 1A]
MVQEGFGDLRAGVERRVGGCNLRMYRDGGFNVYERECGGDIRRVRVAGDKLEVVPAPPVMAEPRVSNIIMLRLPEPLVVSPGSEASIETSIPVDIVVVMGSLVVDAIPTYRVKYALYGNVDKGVITRFVKLGECRAPCASMRIVVRNSGGKPVRIERIVFPAYMLSLCYNGSLVYANSIFVNAVDDVGSVQPGRLEAQECRLAPQLLRAPIFERQRQKFLMLYGF